MRRAIVLCTLALAGCIIVPVSAGAIPVRGLQTFQEDGAVIVSATAYSPPDADQCGARWGVHIFNAYGQRVRVKYGKFNACTDGYRGRTKGFINTWLETQSLARGNYRICVAASQLVNGRRSAHSLCGRRELGPTAYSPGAP
jgi:hypothetical protein